MLKSIGLIGAGKSSYSLIKYLNKQAEEGRIHFYVADIVKPIFPEFPNTHFSEINIEIHSSLSDFIEKSDVIISLLPPSKHIIVAKECLVKRKNFLNASYNSEEFQLLHYDVKKAGLTFLLECGFDPGIDHMSAMKMIDEVRSKGGEIKSFYSNAGGLLSPSSENSPWKYKFTWNPVNVVLAAKEGAKYLKDGKIKIVPYQRVFKSISTSYIEGIGDLEIYPNRDSIPYIEAYNLEGIENFKRGTFRREGFCKAWQFLVEKGFTATEENLKLTLSDFSELTTALGVKQSDIPRDIKAYMDELNIFGNESIPTKTYKPFEALLALLLKKWTISIHDRDRVIMEHILEYELNNELFRTTSSFYLDGKSEKETAMAHTVGIPLGVAAMCIASDMINRRGVSIPTHKTIYALLLPKLSNEGIVFKERTVTYGDK